MNIVKKIDCLGIMCPMPTVKTKLALEELVAGDVLEVIADDPASKKDLPAWCEVVGEKCLEVIDGEDGFIFHIEKV